MPCLHPTENQFSYKCLYFRINPFFKAAHDLGRCTLTVRYLDTADAESFKIQYDSTDRSALMDGAYKDTRVVALQGSGEWKTATFELADARFGGRQNGGADFRIWTGSTALCVRSITLEPAGK